MNKLKFLLMTLIGASIGLLSSCKDDNNAMLEPELSVGESVIELGAIASSKPHEIEIKSNYAWKASRPEADTWCTLSQEEAKLRISLVSNVDTVERTTRITITSGNEENPIVKYIDLKQKAPDRTTLVLSIDQVDLKADGDVVKVEALANTSMLTYIFEDEVPEWCTVKIDGNNIEITAPKNEAMEDRTAKLILTAGEGNNLKTAHLNVVQKGQAPYITFSSDTVYMEHSGEAKTVEVSSNRTWETSILFGGYGFKVERNGNTLTLTSDPSYLLDRRQDKILVKDKENPNFQGVIVVVWRAAEKVLLKVDQQNVVFKKDGGTKDITVTSNYKSRIEFGTETKWLTVKQDGSKISFEAIPSTEELERTATVSVIVGAEENKMSKEIQITQFGTKAGLIISASTILLDEKGGLQEVSVAANGEWGITPNLDASWLTIAPGENKITFSATQAESSRSAAIEVVTGSGASAIKKVINVVQNKTYKVGDIYVLNGKNIGLVYTVSDEGKHGKVISLKTASLATHHPIRSYRVIDVEYNKDFYSNPANVGPKNRDDGNENVKEIKRLINWKHYYPQVAWCDELNETTGNPGWYMPAINELAELATYFTGYEVDDEGGWSYPEDKVDQVTQRAKNINTAIINAGGDRFVITAIDNSDNGQPEDQYLYSTTEAWNGYTEVKTVNMSRGQITGCGVVDKDNFGCATRAIFKF